MLREGPGVRAEIYQRWWGRRAVEERLTGERLQRREG